jgi:hypothetical protein
MREQEMRQRVERFLETRLRSMLMPATLGLGLALAGCNSSPLSSDDDGGQSANHDATSVSHDASSAKQDAFTPTMNDASSAKQDAFTPTMKYMAQIPDAGPELPLAQPDYMAQMPDSGLFVRYGAVMTTDARSGTGPVALYMAQLPTTRS